MKDGCIQAYGKTDEIVTGGLLEKTYEIDVVQYMQESLKIWGNIKA